MLGLPATVVRTLGGSVIDRPSWDSMPMRASDRDLAEDRVDARQWIRIGGRRRSPAVQWWNGSTGWR
jgi:hypothetical protein